MSSSTTSIPLTATDGWIHQDINDQNEIVVTWDAGGRILTRTAKLSNTPIFGLELKLSGTGILDVPVASLGKPDVAMTLLPNGNSDIYYVFTSAAADDAPQEGLWVYKGDYNSLSSLSGTQLYSVDSVYHKTTEGHFGLPRIDMPNTSASSDDAAWSIVVADHHEPHNDIFAASYSNGPGLKEQVLNDGSLGSLPDISLVGVYKNNRPTVAFSPIDNNLYYAWVFEMAPESPTYISVKTTTDLNLMNNPPTGYFLIPLKLYHKPYYPGVALSTNNTFSRLYTAFIEDPSDENHLITLGMKTVDWGPNTGYKQSPTGISENVSKGTFSLYPNPFRKGFQIKATTNTNQNFQIVVFNILGQKVYHSNGKLGKINNGLQSIGETLPSGTYFMKLTGTDGSAFRKEVIKW